MGIDIREHDIRSEVCQSCAACCRIRITVSNTDSRYRLFLRAIAMKVSPPMRENGQDCCGKVHSVSIDMGPCPHLIEDKVDGRSTFSCELYGTSSFPALCADYNCVSWAKA